MATNPEQASPEDIDRALYQSLAAKVVIDGRTQLEGISPPAPGLPKEFTKPGKPQSVVEDVGFIAKRPLRYRPYMFLPSSSLLRKAFAEKGYDVAQAHKLAAASAKLCETLQTMRAPATPAPGPNTHGQELVDELVESIARIRPPTESFAAAGRPNLQLPPDDEIEKYADRPDRKETSKAFLERVWGPFVREGLAFQSDVNRVDPGLVPKVRTYCHHHGIDPATVLPPPSYQQYRVSLPPLSFAQLEAAHREYDRLRQAKRRAGGRTP